MVCDQTPGKDLNLCLTNGGYEQKNKKQKTQQAAHFSGVTAAQWQITSWLQCLVYFCLNHSIVHVPPLSLP